MKYLFSYILIILAPLYFPLALESLSLPFMSSSSCPHPFSGVAPPSKKIKLSASPKLFDVFINHRGADVKKTLARYLHDSLRDMKIEVFLDEDCLEVGESFPPAIDGAICSASVQIAIFSKGYAGSPWCLSELVLMLQTKAKIIPIFYDVQPWEVRYPENGVYGSAFSDYRKKKRYLEKLDDWKEALNSVSFITGYEFSNYNHDQEKLFKSIAPVVRKELGRRIPLYVAKNPVGLDELVEDFERDCVEKMQNRKEKIQMFGIYGMGGCGKTTLAKELFNRKRADYDGSCFLFDVAESELPSLQYKLLKHLVPHIDQSSRFENTKEGKSSLEYHMPKLSRFRFLIVVDNIDHMNQLDAVLVRDGMNPDSLVIVTTRDEAVLKQSGIDVRYMLKEMNVKHATELFCRHAFHQKDPHEGFDELVDSFVKVCGRLPLSLEVLGSCVFNRGKDQWESVLDNARKELHEDVKRILKLSFDNLKSVQQQVFIDIACFFIGKPKSMAIRIWEVSGWNAEFALQSLKEKCLVNLITSRYEEFDEDNVDLSMHYHNCDLGKEMAKAKDFIPPCRLWRPQDLKCSDLRTFQDFLSKANAHSYRCLHIFDLSSRSQITFFVGNSDDSFEASTDLIWLQVNLKNKQHAIIPKEIPLQNVKYLRIVQGRLRRLWENDAQSPLQLKELVLHKVELDVECTRALEKLNCLEKLVLWGRHDDDGNRIIPETMLSSLRKLGHLKSLVLRHLGLQGVVTFRNNSALESPMNSLQKIQIGEEKDVRKVSISGDHCPRIESLHLQFLENLHEISLTLVTTLNFLELRACRNLKVISEISDMLKLAILNIRECPELETQLSIGRLSFLERITIDGCQKLQDITGIEQLKKLKQLHLSALGSQVIRNCINRLETLPSEFTTVIGRAAHGVTSSLTEQQFSDLIGPDTSSDVRKINENGMREVSLKIMPQSFTAIIVCVLVQSEHREKIQIPLSPPDSIECYVGGGEWIVTLIVTAKYNWNPSVSFGIEIKKGCIAMVDRGDEGNILDSLKNIVGQLYET